MNVRSPSIKFILTFRNTFIRFSLLMVDETVRLSEDGKPEQSTQMGRVPMKRCSADINMLQKSVISSFCTKISYICTDSMP